MANAVTVFNPGAVRPAFAAPGAVSAIAKALAGGGSFGKRLSIKGGVFRLMVNGKETATIDERYLDVVIVNAAQKVARVYYPGTFAEGQTVPPACWSLDGDKPSADVKKPQGASCATCVQNQKGSGQGDSKACRYSQYLAVVLANDMEGDVLQLSLPAASIFGKAEGENRPLQDYVRYMLAQGVDVTMLVTRMKFDTNVATPKLFFKPVRWLTPEEHEVCQEKGQSSDALQAITMTVAQTDGVTAPSVAAPAPLTVPAAAAAAAPVDDDEPPPPPSTVGKRKPRTQPAAAAAPEPEPEPQVRATAPAAAARVAPTTSLSEALAAWDD